MNELEDYERNSGATETVSGPRSWLRPWVLTLLHKLAGYVRARKERR